VRAVGVVLGLLALSGCASLQTVRVAPPAAPTGPGVRYLESVPPVAQTAYQCGPAALASVMRHWGRAGDADLIGRTLYRRGTRGVLNFMLAQYAHEQGFWAEIHEATPEALRAWLQRDVPPIVMLQVGPFWSPTYHFVVLRGFNDPAQLFYANTGQAETRAIRYAHFVTRSKRAGSWTLIICPPGRVTWTLSGDQAGELGLLLERAGRLDLAERRYGEALAARPTSVPVRFNLANVYLTTHRRPQAKAIYQALIKEQPGWGPASNNLAWIALEENRPQEAVRLIEVAFQHGAARSYDILDTLGVAYRRLKRLPEARACFQEALRKVPSERSETQWAIRAHLDESQ